MGPSPENRIIIVGARENNLRIEHLEIPRDRLVVVTGPSGSGKSSLVFDTIYREAHRRFTGLVGEKSRFSLARLPAPKAVRIENLSFPIALRPRLSAARLPTFASIAGLFPLVRVLYDRLGKRCCIHCGAAVQSTALAEVLDFLRTSPAGAEILVLGSLTRPGSSECRNQVAALAGRGYSRLYAGGGFYSIEDLQAIVEAGHADLELVIDIFRSGPTGESRLVEAVHTGLTELEQLCVTIEGKRFVISTVPLCANCGSRNEVLRASSFNYFARHSACSACRGFGVVLRFREEALRQNGHFEPWVLSCLGPEKLHALVDGAAPRPSGDSPGAPAQLSVAAEHAARALSNLWFSSGDLKLRSRIEERGTLMRCPECGGARVEAAARGCSLGGLAFAELLTGSVSQAACWAALLPGPIENYASVHPQLGQLLRRAAAELSARLQWLEAVGLGYLQLDRSARSLSSGELYRAELGRSLGRPLAGLLCLLDEPAAGLHPRDLERVIKALRELVRLGNSLVVVEHHPLLIAAADYLIELGPGGGREGGRVTFCCSGEEISTRAFLPMPKAQIGSLGRPRGELLIRGAGKHNLRGFDLSFPLGAVSAVSGVSGSGKSTLIFESLGLCITKLLQRELPAEAIFAQAGVRAVENWEGFSAMVDSRGYVRGRSRRSTVATAAGVLGPLRRLFSKTASARMLGLNERHFSFNTPEGWCETCKGLGLQETDANQIFVACPHCQGSRFNSHVRLVTYRGLTLPDMLALSVEEAAALLTMIPGVGTVLSRYLDFGLGYLCLDQSSVTLSLGERERVRLIADIGRAAPASKQTLYLFDEPCRGLSRTEIPKLLSLMRQLTGEGGTVIAVEHHPHFVESVDYVVELGPGAGPDGGEIVFAGRAADFSLNGQ